MQEFIDNFNIKKENLGMTKLGLNPNEQFAFTGDLLKYWLS